MRIWIHSKKHKATLQNLPTGNDCIITFEDPDTSNGAMKFVYVDGALHIQGDYGNATFNWNNKNNHILAYGTFNSFGYVLSKLVSCNDNELNGWDSDLFAKEWEEFIQDRLEEGYTIEPDMTELPYAIENIHNVITFFMEHSEEYGNDLFDTGAYTLGQYVKERPYMWWQGLQTALDMLEQQGAFDKGRNPCEGCTHKPKREGIDNYPDECGTCKRFYGDEWEKEI
ncbi:MAG: hypothetical protein Q9M40_07280 [Sulfurimonas sp.]|nr:hypothetical protein [Sulfurimonas sp.]